MIQDFLNLPPLRALEIDDLGDHYRVLADGQAEPACCPQCQRDTMQGHGRQRQEFIDTPMHGKRVLIEIERRRYRCKICGKTTFSGLLNVESKRQATSRLITYIEQHCLRRTFAEIARDVGVDERTIRHIFDDYVERLSREVKFETPEVLGIDELKIIGQYRAMITNITELALFDMLPTRKKADLITYFKRLPDKHRVRVVTMDLWNVYRQVIDVELPGRLIIVDRWHVIRMANDAMEKVRKLIRKGLDTRTRLKLKDDRFLLLARRRELNEVQRDLLDRWFAQFPALGAAYKAKETFHCLYEHDSRREAERAAQAWLNGIPGLVAPQFKETATALRNWWEPVFNYYEHPISNGYTESINRLAKDMNRMGRGYSFDVIRARLVYDEKARRPNRKTLRQRIRSTSAPSDAAVTDYLTFTRAAASTTTESRTINYGPHIPRLCGLLEAGHFE